MSGSIGRYLSTSCVVDVAEVFNVPCVSTEVLLLAAASAAESGTPDTARGSTYNVPKTLQRASAFPGGCTYRYVAPWVWISSG